MTLPADVDEALHRYLAAREAGLCEGPLFVSAGNRMRGKRLTTRGVRDRVNRYLTRAGIKHDHGRKVTPFSLRHTAAVRMARAGATPGEIMKRMRLGSAATAQLYINYVNRTPLQQQ